MNEMNINLRKLLQSANVTHESNLTLSNLPDQQVIDLVRDGFFLSLIVLFFIFALKFTYNFIILCKVMTSNDESHSYPGGCNLCCELISTVLMFLLVISGLVAIKADFYPFILGMIYCTGMASALINDFISLITLCSMEQHSEYSLSLGLISMVLVIVESLSVHTGAFFAYFAFKKFQNENPDIKFWPLN